jgi:hypothetical protein
MYTVISHSARGYSLYQAESISELSNELFLNCQFALNNALLNMRASRAGEYMLRDNARLIID